jgi:hypothetical protein
MSAAADRLHHALVAIATEASSTESITQAFDMLAPGLRKAVGDALLCSRENGREGRGRPSLPDAEALERIRSAIASGTLRADAVDIEAHRLTRREGGEHHAHAQRLRRKLREKDAQKSFLCASAAEIVSDAISDGRQSGKTESAERK